MNGLWFGLERLRERVANAIAGMDTAVSQLGCVDLGGLNVPFRRHAVDARGAAGEEGMKTGGAVIDQTGSTSNFVARPLCPTTTTPARVPPRIRIRHLYQTMSRLFRKLERLAHR